MRHKSLGRSLTTRRSVLKGALATGAATAISPPFIARAQSVTEINLLSWYGHGEPDMVAAFEETNKVKINAKYYVGGDNMLGLISQSPPGTYDIILADAEYVSILVQADYLERLEENDFPFEDYWPEFQEIPGVRQGSDLHAVPIRVGFLGLSYHQDALSEREARSYEVMWSAPLKDKVGHFDWHLPNIGCVSLLEGNAAPFDLSDGAWSQVQDRTMSLRPQVRSFLDYGGVLSSLKNAEVGAIPGIGDWITGVLQKDGAKVTTTIPEQGGLQWTECLGIGKGSHKADLARRFIRYVTSPEGQVRTANLAAYPAISVTKPGWSALDKVNPAEAQRQGMTLSGASVLDDFRAGRIRYRRLPVRQSLEEWNDFWSDYKNA
ncbi:MAG: extracellular solute-binding protein [Kiloniellales bacterium]|nr:extracellular solute-binding protein [Kiloniellales bacterium]